VIFAVILMVRHRRARGPESADVVGASNQSPRFSVSE
jgi:hypothetical protein